MKRMWSEDELFAVLKLYSHSVKLKYTDDSGNSNAQAFFSYASFHSTAAANRDYIPDYAILAARGTAENSLGEALDLLDIKREGGKIIFRYFNPATSGIEEYSFTGSVYILSDTVTQIQ